MATEGFTLQSLILHLPYDRSSKDLIGEVTFVGQLGSVKVAVDAEVSKGILKLVAEHMALATKKLADNMTASIFDQSMLPQLTENIEVPVAGVTTAATDPDDDIPF